MLWGACLPMGSAWSEPAPRTPVQEASQIPSRADWYRSLVRKGHVSERLGQKQDALADYTLAIESRTLAGNEQAQILFDRGLLLEAMGRPNDALTDYSAALSLTPDFAAARNRRAGLYAQTGEAAQAQGRIVEAGDFHDRSQAADPNLRSAAGEMNMPTAGGEGSRAGAPIPTAVGGGKASPAGRHRQAQLQLGAWRSPQKAELGWNHAKALASDVLEGASPRIVAVDLPGTGRFYRLRVTVAQTGSGGLCVALAAKGLDCLLIHD
jgi:tetratricopeptide (TPR) repeat protein